MSFYIQNVDTGLVLDIKGAKRTASAEVIMYPYNGNPNQLWTYTNNMIYSQLNGLVLDVSGKTGDVITYPSNGGANQLWYFEPDSTIRSGNGKVLDVFGGKRAPGTKLISYPKNGGANQKFTRVPVGGGHCHPAQPPYNYGFRG